MTNAMPNQDKPNDPIDNLIGAFSDPKSISQRLRWAKENCHLISPGTTCARLPEGCSVAISVVWMDPRVDAHSVGGGKVSLLKHALAVLAGAAGVRFDPHSSGRLDDGSDPNYVHWKAVGAWQGLDGSVLPIVGDKEMDLRDGSAQVERILAKAEKDPLGQLRDVRAFILAHAQSKAELRAIRKGLGLRSYTPMELSDRPFVVVKLMFTGYSDDPQIRRENAAAIRATMLGGASALFGPPPAPVAHGLVAPMPLPALSMPTQPVAALTTGHRPPPVGSSMDDDEMDEPAAPVAAPAPRLKARATSASSSDGAVAKFGKGKGQPLSEMSHEDLDWYLGAVRKSVDDPEKARFRAGNEAHYREVLAEKERREGGPAEQRSAPKSPPAQADFDRGDDPNQY
jgi:hypothetical protein